MLVARRGLAPADLRLIDPIFASAVRWAVFVEKAYEPVPALTRASLGTPEGLRGQALIDFNRGKSQARKALTEIRRALLLDDADG